jgi:hypothetical protein
MAKRMNWTRARKPVAAPFPSNERLNRAADRWLGGEPPTKPEKRGWNDSRGPAGPCVSLITGERVEFGPPAARHLQQPYAGPSPAEIKRGMSPAGGFTKATLAEWGVPWPAPKGWRRDLERRWKAAHPGVPRYDSDR